MVSIKGEGGTEVLQMISHIKIKFYEKLKKFTLKLQRS
jgi:hypothetical protein